MSNTTADSQALAAAPPTVYLGLSGVVHPSESTYRLLRGRSPWSDGHAKYESVGVLEQALLPWPDARIVLTSTQPWAYGLPVVLESLGPTLATRVDGYTYQDLTEKVPRSPIQPGGPTREGTMSDEDYWRMNKSGIVASHVSWRRPRSWVVLDDENIAWADDVRRNQLVLTEPCSGLLDPHAVARLVQVLRMNFSAAADFSA